MNINLKLRALKHTRLKQYKSYYQMKCIYWIEAKKELYILPRQRTKYWQEKPTFKTLNYEYRIKIASTTR